MELPLNLEFKAFATCTLLQLHVSSNQIELKYQITHTFNFMFFRVDRILLILLFANALEFCRLIMSFNYHDELKHWGHMFAKAQLNSGKMVHKKRWRFLPQFTALPFHMAWSFGLRVLAQESRGIGIGQSAGLCGHAEFTEDSCTEATPLFCLTPGQYFAVYPIPIPLLSWN